MSIYDDDPELKSLMNYFISIRDQRPTFDSFMDLTDESSDLDISRMKFEIRDDFVGNLIFRTLHGGLISAVLDTVGGGAVFFNVYKQVKGKPRETQVKRISKNATVDIRVDFLRPGVGKVFIATAWILRAGNKFAVTRMELHNEEGVLIAVGTGTYAMG
jgi:uncharacterized protein (TIGR00369 family)